MVKIARTYTSKLQVPIDKEIHDGLRRRAEKLGFDSAQAYVRFWATAEVSGHNIQGEYHDLMRPEVQALRYIELILAINKHSYKTPQEALACVVKQINRIRALHELGKELGYRRSPL